jgi:hypothetical protein
MPTLSEHWTLGEPTERRDLTLVLVDHGTRGYGMPRRWPYVVTISIDDRNDRPMYLGAMGGGYASETFGGNVQVFAYCDPTPERFAEAMAIAEDDLTACRAAARQLLEGLERKA